MNSRLSVRYAWEALAALGAAAAAVAVLYTFVVGRHFIIPTVILALAVLLGNLAWHGYRNRAWAKHTLFWIGTIATAHGFFALFWAKKYRELLGGSFEWVCGALVLLLGWMTIAYARRNALFRRSPADLGNDAR